MTFSEELKSWREAHGLTQQQAADYLRVKCKTYENWEQGRNEPSSIGPVRLAMELKTINAVAMPILHEVHS